MRLRWAVLLPAVIGIVGCSSQSSTSGNPPPTAQDPSYTALIAAAHLPPCPSSTRSTGDLPNVTLTCLGRGPAVRMSGLTGKPTVVNVWASWCIPCQKEAAYLGAAAAADEPTVRFLGVDTQDSASSALDFVSKLTRSGHYPSVVDPNKKVLLSAAKQAGPPATLFVDATGNIAHVFHGSYTSTAQLQRDIATYLHVQT